MKRKPPRVQIFLLAIVLPGMLAPTLCSQEPYVPPSAETFDPSGDDLFAPDTPEPGEIDTDSPFPDVPASQPPASQPAASELPGTDALPQPGGAFSPIRSETATAPGTGTRQTLVDCRVVALSEPIIAGAESGLLVMAPELGAEVKKDMVIAKTDDTVAVLQHRTAFKQYQAERIKLESDIEERYARKQAEVKEAAYRDGLDANQKIKNAVSQNMMRERKADWEAAELGIEKSIHDMRITKAGAMVRLAEFETAGELVERHKIKSPVNGIIEEVLKHEGEWVTPGDPIAKLVQLNRVRVIGRLDVGAVSSPRKLKGLPVTIEVPVQRDASGEPTQFKSFQSTIVHVGSSVTSGREYEIYAEVENSADYDFWPGINDAVMSFNAP